MIEFDNLNKDFSPTVSWMYLRYYELNELLFNNKLGYCNFQIFTSGKGSEGRVLGTFRMRPNIKYNIDTRRMSYENEFNHITINSDNFVSICKPVISLNGNYTGTEYAFLTTLIHEMCHYYNYMDGIAPYGGSHGREFENAVYFASSNSNGLFPYKDILTSENVMSNFVLNDKLQQKKNKRIENKKSSMYAILDYRMNGKICLTTTKSKSLIDKIMDFSNRHANNPSKQIIISNDPQLINLLYNEGYRTAMRSWSYYDVTNDNWLSLLDTIDKKVFNNPNINDNKKYNMKQTIKLTESQLKRLISESVRQLLEYNINNRIINESYCYLDRSDDTIRFEDIIYDSPLLKKWYSELEREYNNNADAQKLIDTLENDEKYWTVKLDIDYYVTPYDSGDGYMRPPSGGEFRGDVTPNNEDLKKFEEILPPDIYNEFKISIDNFINNRIIDELLENYEEYYDEPDYHPEDWE